MVALYLTVGLVGACVGGFIHRCVERLPYEKSLLWPGNRCSLCAQRLPVWSCIPLFGYWLVGRRCPTCQGAVPFSSWGTQVATAGLFVGLCYLEIDRNVLHIGFLSRVSRPLSIQTLPWQAWIVFGWHALLLSFLLIASLCDLRHMEIPLSLTMTGTLVGLIGSAFLAWPFPGSDRIAEATFLNPFPRIPHGLYPWPVWNDLPTWMGPGTWQLGLATGLVGAAVGMLVLRGVRFLFGLGRGLEGMGVGDADLMMMAGAFVGWQIVVVAFFVAVFPGLVLALGTLFLRGEQSLPFGPPLAGGVLITLLGWNAIGKQMQPIFTSGEFLAILVVLGAVILLSMAFLLRLLRGGTPKAG